MQDWSQGGKHGGAASDVLHRRSSCVWADADMVRGVWRSPRRVCRAAVLFRVQLRAGTNRWRRPARRSDQTGLRAGRCRASRRPMDTAATISWWHVLKQRHDKESSQVNTDGIDTQATSSDAVCAQPMAIRAVTKKAAAKPAAKKAAKPAAKKAAAKPAAKKAAKPAAKKAAAKPAEKKAAKPAAKKAAAKPAAKK